MFAIPAAVKAIAETKAAPIPEPLKVYREAAAMPNEPDNDDFYSCSFTVSFCGGTIPEHIQMTDRMK